MESGDVVVRGPGGAWGTRGPHAVVAAITPFVLAMLVACASFRIAAQSHLWDRDEARFARATVEMIESGDYLVPTFNGEPRLHKPPLIYWLMSVAVRVAGPTELAFRFFSCLAAGGTCLITCFIGRRLLSAEAGLWSMAVLAFTLMMIYVGAAATTDSVLLFLTTAQMGLFLRAWTVGPRALDVLWLGLTIGASLLAKGPAGLWPLAVMIGIMVPWRRTAHAHRMFLAVCCGSIMGFLLFLAWAIPANNATGGAFLREGVGLHVIGRTLTPLEGHGGGIGAFLFYYPVVILVGFIPWSGLLPMVISSAARAQIGGEIFRRVFFLWAAVPLVLMSFVQTKLPHYIAPIMPPLALATGGLITHWRQHGIGEREMGQLQWIMRVALGTTIMAGVFLIVAPRYLGVPGLWAPSAMAGGVMIAGSLAIFRFRNSGFHRMLLGVMGVMAVIMLPVIHGALPALDAIKLGPALAADVRALAGKGTPVASYGAQEPSVNFYVGRRIEELETVDGVRSWLQRHPGALMLMARERKDFLEKNSGALPADVVSSRRGFNYSKGAWTEGLILRAH